MEIQVLDTEREPPTSRVVIVMGTRDESVPLESVRRVWEAWQESGRLAMGSRFIAISEGDHGLVQHTEIIAREITRLASERSPR